MTEPLPAPEIPQETLAYQPVSAWAIAGLAVGALFALLIVISGVTALVQGVPVFFPLWILVAPLLGLVLSLVGQWHVQNSEGTRAGAKLARAGVWLSLVGGLGYFSYSYFTGLALQNQANDFLMEMGEDSGFFPRLRKLLPDGSNDPVQINTAFLLTLPATQRSDNCPPDNEYAMRSHYDRPKDGMPGKLFSFREGLFARAFFKDLAIKAEITPLAVQEWHYAEHSYKILRIYRMKTAEMSMEILITVQSTEPESAGQNRKWFVNLNECYPVPGSKQLTPVGKGVAELRSRARETLEGWVQSLNSGESFAAFKERDQAWNYALMLVGIDDRNADSGKAARAAMRETVTHAFTGTEKNRIAGLKVFVRSDDVGRWEQIDGKVRVYLYFRFNLPDAKEGGPPGGFVVGYAVLDTRQAIDPARFGPASQAPEWDINRIVVTHVIPPAPKGK